MTRHTVIIQMPNETGPRSFHLRSDKADAFAAKVRAEGGTATVGPLAISVSLVKALERAGIAAGDVK